MCGRAGQNVQVSYILKFPKGADNVTAVPVGKGFRNASVPVLVELCQIQQMSVVTLPMPSDVSLHQR